MRGESAKKAFRAPPPPSVNELSALLSSSAPTSGEKAEAADEPSSSPADASCPPAGERKPDGHDEAKEGKNIVKLATTVRAVEVQQSGSRYTRPITISSGDADDVDAAIVSSTSPMYTLPGAHGNLPTSGVR